MNYKNILIFIGLLLISDVFIYYIHEQSHKYDEPAVEATAYDNVLPYENITSGDVFELGPKTHQPWGASMFCKENPEKCGMN